MNKKQALIKTIDSFKNFLPVILGTVLIIGIFLSAIPKNLYGQIFTQNNLFDSMVGGIIGSIAAGSPIVSYLIGGELLVEGISLVAITAFIVAWVTVGIIQLPAETNQLGLKFALTRNLISFISAIIIAILTTLTINLL
jgi:hypothetical protein